MPYPAAEIDPAGRFFPASGWFHFQRDGRNYFPYLPYFPAASAVPYRLFGHYGLLVREGTAAGGRVSWFR